MTPRPSPPSPGRPWPWRCGRRGDALGRGRARHRAAGRRGAPGAGARDDAARPLHDGPGARCPAPRAAAFEALVARRARHEPVQYLLGRGRVLRPPARGRARASFIPRPETEVLVDAARSALGLADRRGRRPLHGLRRDRVRPRGAPPGLDRLGGRAAARGRRVRAGANVRRLGLEGRVRVREGDLFAPLAGRGRAGAWTSWWPTRPIWRRRSLADLARRGPRLGAAGRARRRLGRPRCRSAGCSPPRPGGSGPAGRSRGDRRGAGPGGARARRRRTRGIAAAGVHRDFRGRERVLEARRR